ncbi:MAG: tetratricopeptide repeat protein [Candidatus Omnitrophica bacterium]|nr:tetratricopeptide repeat protein [Candidatus Omnitrophota bacterium]
MKKFWLLLVLILAVIGCQAKENKEQFQGVKAKHDYIAQGHKYLTSGDVKNAIANFDKAIQQDPTNPENYLILGQVYLHLKNYKRAVDTFSAASRVDPSSGETFYLLSLSRAFEGQKEEAIKAAKQSALIFQKTNEVAKMNRALSLWKSLSETMPSVPIDPTSLEKLQQPAESGTN